MLREKILVASPTRTYIYSRIRSEMKSYHMSIMAKSTYTHIINYNEQVELIRYNDNNYITTELATYLLNTQTDFPRSQAVPITDVCPQRHLPSEPWKKKKEISTYGLWSLSHCQVLKYKWSTAYEIEIIH